MRKETEQNVGFGIWCILHCFKKDEEAKCLCLKTVECPCNQQALPLILSYHSKFCEALDCFAGSHTFTSPQPLEKSRISPLNLENLISRSSKSEKQVFTLQFFDDLLCTACRCRGERASWCGGRWLKRKIVPRGLKGWIAFFQSGAPENGPRWLS